MNFNLTFIHGTFNRIVLFWFWFNYSLRQIDFFYYQMVDFRIFNKFYWILKKIEIWRIIEILCYNRENI